MFEELGADLDGFDFRQESVTVEGPIVLFEWGARSAEGRTARGADSFYIDGDRIRHQTLTYQKSDG